MARNRCHPEKILDHENTYFFSGDARYRALKLCGWGTDESELKIFLSKLEGKKQFARAAALAVFNLEIRMALQILEKVNSEEETLVAMGNFDCGVFN